MSPKALTGRIAMSFQSADHSLAEFSSALNRRYGRYVVEPVGPISRGYGSMRERALGPISVHLMTVDGLLSRRAALAEELRHLTFLIAPVHGDLVIEQYERTSRLGPGDALLLDSLAGCTIVALNACTALSIELRRSTLSRFGVPAHELCARRIAGDGRVGGLLSNMVSTVAAGALDYGSQDGVILEDVLATVAARSLLCESSAAEESRTRALILRMREWMLLIRRNCSGPTQHIGCVDS